MEGVYNGNIPEALKIGKDRIYKIVSNSNFTEFVESSAQFDVRGGIFKDHNSHVGEFRNRERS